MAAPRRDAYGRPLPELVDARHELLRDHPQNQARERYVLDCLDDWFATLLRRGVYAELVIRVTMNDGILHPDVTIGVTRPYHGPEKPKPE